MFELVLHVPQALAEPASDALITQCDALSVSLEDADAHTAIESPLFGEPGIVPQTADWPRSVLKALFAGEAQATQAATLLLAQAEFAELRLQTIAPVPDEDWVRLTQSQFAPVAITPQFWVVPSWHRPPPQALRVIRLDPGLAFGTGTHATTRMCLRWIASHATPWQRVLDYGCGSGILAIAAALHGAHDVDAVDIDPAAVASTHANAAANGVALKAGMPEAAAGEYPLVLANILAQPLKLLAPLLCSHLAHEGDLVLAGILDRQAAELQAAYAPWCRLEAADHDDGWVLLTARRTEAP